MEKFVLLSQATCLSVVFYVVIYFLISWHWPEPLLSVFVCTVVFANSLRYAPRAALAGETGNKVFYFPIAGTVILSEACIQLLDRLTPRSHPRRPRVMGCFSM